MRHTVTSWLLRSPISPAGRAWGKQEETVGEAIVEERETEAISADEVPELVEAI